MKFTGENGRKPSTEARRHVYRMIATMLTHELTDSDGWVFGGIEDPFDRRRLKEAVKKVTVEMRRKAEKEG